MSQENIILVDWFTFVVKNPVPTPEEVASLIGLSGASWMVRGGHYGYHKAWFLGGIWIMFDAADNDKMGVCVEMTGQGCRQFESSSLISFAELFEIVTGDTERFHVTRLDVAFDDVDKKGKGLLDIVKIAKHGYQGRFIGKLSSSMPQVKCKPDEVGNVARAHTVYFGSEQSKIRIRFYDKAMERGGYDYHWVRCELQLRYENSLNYLRSKVSWGERFYGVLNNYLRFIIPSKTDTNRRRWPSPGWWTDFLQSVERISLYTPKGVEYNLTRLERYVIGQAGNSIETYIQCVGKMKFFEMLHHKETLFNANQLALMAEYKTLEEKRLAENPFVKSIRGPGTRF